MSKDTKTPEAESTVDLKAYAEEIAKATAAKIAMQQAEQKSQGTSGSR